MPGQQVLDVVAQEVEMGCRTIIPHHLGEPTLHPEYEVIIRTIRAQFPEIELKLFTNGSRLLEDKIRHAIAECGDYVVVSVDGFRPATMARTRPGLDTGKVLRGFDLLARMQRRGGLVTQGVIVPGVTDKETTAYSRVWRSRGADEGYPYLDVRARHEVFPNPCSRIYTQIDVRVDGSVGICCRDPQNQYPLGSAFDEGVKGAWYGPKAREFRRKHRAGEIPLCRVCTWEGVFSGDPEEFE
jgi:hypothetical protein